MAAATVDADGQGAEGISNMELNATRPSAVAGVDDRLRGGAKWGGHWTPPQREAMDQGSLANTTCTSGLRDL